MNTNDPNFSWGVGQKIKHLRERLGLSQREIGNELGVTLQQIQKYEKGMNDPSLVGLAKICRALNVTPNELLDFDDPHRVQQRSGNSWARSSRNE